LRAGGSYGTVDKDATAERYATVFARVEKKGVDFVQNLHESMLKDYLKGKIISFAAGATKAEIVTLVRAQLPR